MIKVNYFLFSQLFRFLLLVSFFFAVSCAHKLQFPINYTNDPTLNQIKKLAIGDIEVRQNDLLVLNDHMGNWSEQKKKMNIKGLNTLIRESIKANLQQYATFEILDISETAVLTKNRFSSLVPKAGFRMKGLDAVMNITMTISNVTQQGQTQKLEVFRTNASQKVKKGKSYTWKTIENRSEDRVMNVPYQSQTVSLLLNIELINVRDGKYKLLKEVNDTYVLSFITGTDYPQFRTSDNNAPLYQLDHVVYSQLPPDWKNIVKRAVVLTGTKILPHISSYKLMVTRGIDTSGEKESVEFLKKGQVEAALNRLQKFTSKSQESVSASDKYNQGVCYEAIGEPMIANQLYEEALSLDEGNEMYIQAIGGVETLYMK